MILTICSIISAISTIFIAIQLFQSARCEKKHHEEMRRIKTVEIMENWSKSLKRETSFAEKIVEGFSEEQCRALFFKEEFELDKKKSEDICQLCHENSCHSSQAQEKCERCITNNTFKLSGAQLSEFRWYVVGYLNMLESVMTAWNLNIVDREEIEDQFQYLYNPEKGWNALKPFRDAAGGMNAYPNIEKFMQTLEKKRNKTSRERPKL
ncbi:MAG: hypothetical protein NC416_02105 [Eubacterium sp.]|nr:hypothetical protein [Eubacterium sp.]